MVLISHTNAEFPSKTVTIVIFCVVNTATEKESVGVSAGASGPPAPPPRLQYPDGLLDDIRKGQCFGVIVSSRCVWSLQ